LKLLCKNENITYIFLVESKYPSKQQYKFKNDTIYIKKKSLVDTDKKVSNLVVFQSK